MLYVIFGTYKTVINNKSKSLTKKILNDDINDLNFSKIDYSESSLDKVIEEISFLPFGYDKKVILINSGELLIKEKDLNGFIDQINLNCDYVDVILCVFASKISAKMFENVENKQIIEVKQLSDDDWNKYIRLFLSKRGVEIDNDAVYELHRRCNGDVDALTVELDKISNYSNHLTLKDIDALVNEPLDENSFNLLNYLIENKKEKALKNFHDLLIKNNDPILLISMISTQLKFLNEVNYLYKVEHMSKDQIATMLKTSSGRIYYTLKSLNNLDQKTIDDAFDNLYKLDNDIKHGLIDKNTGFELFILNFGGK